MNRYLNKLIMYHEIHKLSREGLNISQIADYLGLNWRTVKKQLEMDEREFETRLENTESRPKVLCAYEHFVKTKLDTYPDSSAAQIHDWLKEYDDGFPEVHPKTVYNYVMGIRQKFNIPKIKTPRDFFTVEELPMGKQAQVDFGEYNMRSSTGKAKKVYFMVVVLSRSRYKHVYFSAVPFTSAIAVLAHEKAFGFFEGIPQELVYDQDKVFLSDENAGDLLLTQVFKAYVDKRGFTTYFCRKADPQSKGKVENAVKYVKQNFLYNRPYYDIETLNDEAEAWLYRTANNMEHGTTKLVPREQWAEEKQHLASFAPIELDINPGKEYTVRQDNTISYNSNLYTVPQGTYKNKDSKVSLKIEGEEITISSLSGDELCRHKISLSKGKKIINKNHKRDNSEKIETLKTQVADMFEDSGKALGYLDKVHNHVKRYIRDALLMIRECFDQYQHGTINQTLDYCTENEIYTSHDFRSVAEHFKKSLDNDSPDSAPANIKPIPGCKRQLENLQPNQSNIFDYEAIMSNTN